MTGDGNKSGKRQVDHMTSNRVIHTFRERREIDLQLQEIAREQDELSRESMARALAERGEAVIPVLLRHLKTTNPLLRGAIGLVAMFLPRESIAPRLRDIASNPKRTDQERIAALMILERYLEEPVEESLYAELRNPQAVLEQSLREIVEHQDAVPDIVQDYISQLQEEPAEVAHAIIQLSSRFSAEKVLPVLALLAQDVREEVAEPALHTLSRMRLPQALCVLDTLAGLLPSPLQEVAQRGARKLRMSGVQKENPPQVRWRALVSPPDVFGGQTFWLAREESGEQEMIGVLGNMDLGLQFAFRLRDVPPDFVPEPENGARMVTVSSPDGTEEGPFLFLDAPLGHVRRWLRVFMHQNYTAEYQLPVVFRQHILRFWWETEQEGLTPPPSAPEPSDDAYLNPLLLFQHPALAAWYVEPPSNVLEERRWLRAGLSERVFTEILSTIDPQAFPAPFWREVAQRLVYMAEWLLIAQETEHARHALAAARSLHQWPHVRNPFAQILLARGLALIFQRLQEAKDQWER